MSDSENSSLMPGIAVIGAGYWGANLVRNVRASPALRLTAICDHDSQAALRVAGRGHESLCGKDLESVLQDESTNGVIIATPAATHAELAIAALEAGKHVLVEKPMASSFDEGVRMLHASRAKRRSLMVDHTFCYTAAVRRLRQLVRSGELGDIQYIDAVRINLGLVQSDVDVLWDLAPHDLSILNAILPDDVSPVAVSAHAADPSGMGRACVAYVTVKLSNGALAHAHVNWLAPVKIRATVVGGSRKTAVWNDLDPVQPLSIYDRGVNWPDESQDRRVSYRIGDMVAPALVKEEALGMVVAEFADAISGRRTPLTDGVAGLVVLGMLDAATRSMEQGGGFVELPDLTSLFTDVGEFVDLVR